MRIYYPLLCSVFLLLLSCQPVVEPDDTVVPKSNDTKEAEFTLLISQYGYSGNPLVAIRSIDLLPTVRNFPGGGSISIDPVKKIAYWMSTARTPRDPFKQDKINVYDYKSHVFLPDLAIGNSTDSTRLYNLYYDLSTSADQRFLYVICGLIDYGKSRQFDLLKVDLGARSIKQRLSLNEGMDLVSENPMNGRLYLADDQTIMSMDASFSPPIPVYKVPDDAVINFMRCSSDGAIWVLVSLYNQVGTGGFSFDKGLMLQLSVDQTGKLALIKSLELPQSTYHVNPSFLPIYRNSTPNSLVFGPDSTLFVGTSPNGRVFRYDRRTNQFNPNSIYAENNDVSGSYRQVVSIAGIAVVSGEFR
jgi:WD40 repeat protein